MEGSVGGAVVRTRVRGAGYGRFGSEAPFGGGWGGLDSWIEWCFSAVCRGEEALELRGEEVRLWLRVRVCRGFSTRSWRLRIEGTRGWGVPRGEIIARRWAVGGATGGKNGDVGERR